MVEFNELTASAWLDDEDMSWLGKEHGPGDENVRYISIILLSLILLGLTGAQISHETEVLVRRLRLSLGDSIGQSLLIA